MKYLNRVYFLLIGITKPIFTMFVIYMGYLVFGGMCFVTLETSQEDKARKKTMEAIRHAKDMIAILRAYNYSDNEINDAFLHERQSLLRRIDVHWTSRFAEKVHFSFVLISSIGYGNVASTTNTGQIVTVLYTLVGIPLHFNVMRLLSVKFRGCLRKLFKIGQKIYPSSNLLLMIFGVLFFLLWTTLLIFVPACIFTKTDDWHFHTGLYYIFASLTTAGFGDYVAGVSHITSDYYFVEVMGLLVWMFFGLSYVFMAINLLSYAMGLIILDKLDCNCEERADARKKLIPLFDLVFEITFQLSKSKPDKFYSWDEIEEFKSVMTGNPENVTVQMLLKLFDIAIELKETAYDHLSMLNIAHIQMTPAILHAKETLPSLDDLPTAPKFDEETFIPDSSTIWPGESSEEISNDDDDDDRQSNKIVQDEEKRLVTDIARPGPYRERDISSRKTEDLDRNVQNKHYTIEENKKNRVNDENQEDLHKDNSTRRTSSEVYKRASKTEDSSTTNVENQDDVNKDNSTRRTSSEEKSTSKTEDSSTTNVENQEDVNKNNSIRRTSSEENQSTGKTKDSSTISKVGKRSEDKDENGEKR